MKNLSILQQLVARLKAKSPKLFQVITTISTIAAFVMGIPELLEQFSITLPEVVQPLASKAVAICSLIVAFISALTVDTPKATEAVLTDVNAGVKPANAVRGK